MWICEKGGNCVDPCDERCGRYIEVEPVVHGRWIQEYRVEEMRYSPDDIERYKVPDGFSCSICSKWSSEETNYCPNCGARMDLKGD